MSKYRAYDVKTEYDAFFFSLKNIHKKLLYPEVDAFVDRFPDKTQATSPTECLKRDDRQNFTSYFSYFQFNISQHLWQKDIKI